MVISSRQPSNEMTSHAYHSHGKESCPITNFQGLKVTKDMKLWTRIIQIIFFMLQLQMGVPTFQLLWQKNSTFWSMIDTSTRKINTQCRFMGTLDVELLRSKDERAAVLKKANFKRLDIRSTACRKGCVLEVKIKLCLNAWFCRQKRILWLVELGCDTFSKRTHTGYIGTLF